MAVVSCCFTGKRIWYVVKAVALFAPQSQRGWKLAHHIFDWHYFPSDDMSRELKGSLSVAFLKFPWCCCISVSGGFLTEGSCLFDVVSHGRKSKDCGARDSKPSEHGIQEMEQSFSPYSHLDFHGEGRITFNTLPGFDSLPFTMGCYGLPLRRNLPGAFPTVTAEKHPGTGVPSVRQCTAVGGPWWHGKKHQISRSEKL